MPNQLPRTGQAEIRAEVALRISWKIEETTRQPVSEEWDEQFESMVRAHLPFLAADQPLTPDLDLRASGLDSLGVVDLLVGLESAYGVRLTEEAMSMDTFATPGVLWSTLSKIYGVTELSVHDLDERRGQ